MVSSEQVCALTGITYRQLDYWVRKGRIPGINRAGSGSGRSRDFTNAQVELIRRVSIEVKDGWSVEAAFRHVNDPAAKVSGMETITEQLTKGSLNANRQTSPYPSLLAELVDQTVYRPGWRVALSDLDRGQGSAGLTLVIITRGYDSYHPEKGQDYDVHYYFPVPPAAYDRRSWQRWLFEQYLLVERHECMEFFQIDGERPYSPSHGPGNDPYIVREIGTETDVKTAFTGIL